MDVLRHCFPAGIRRALGELPETLDETYERTLRDIDEQNWDYAHLMFQCIAVASRPLRVKELAEFLAFDFDAGPIPTFLPDWRPEDARDAVLSICSSMIAIVNVDGSWIIQFAHFFVQEYLTSPRLAMARDRISRRYHVPMTPAHTVVAQACLGILLHLDDQISSTTLTNFPLAEYAAQYWIDHAQFENVSSFAQDGMKRLFDPTKPHFAVWVWIYDADTGSIASIRSESPSRPRGSPLHYAVLYGLRDVARFLIIEHSQNVNARSGSRNMTLLSVASDKRHLDVIRLLLEHCANPNVLGDGHRTPLHGVSQRGDVEIAQVLLEYGANANSQDHLNRTPLHQALQAGYLDVVRVLLEHGADPDFRDSYQETPLHQASHGGYPNVARVLLEHGAHPSSRACDEETPLYQASRGGHLDVVRVLLERGADPNLRDSNPIKRLHCIRRRNEDIWMLFRPFWNTVQIQIPGTLIKRLHCIRHRTEDI